MSKSVLKILILTLTFLTRTTSTSAMARCGNCGRTPVPYPLSTAPNCGDQSYKIRCTGGTLWFDAMNGSSYTITSINSLTQRIVIQPASLARDACVASDMRTQGIQLDDNLPFNITSSNTILLLNCSDAMLNLQAPINCSSNCVCHSYIKDNAPACMRSSLCCMFRTGGSQTSYVVRVDGGGCAAYQSFVNLDSKWAPAKKWPDPGLELEWELPQEPVCKVPVDCKDLLHSNCLADPETWGQKRCFCKSGFKWDPIDGLCQSAKCRNGKICKPKKKQMSLIAGVVGAVGSVSLAVMTGILVYKKNQQKKKEAQKNLIKGREEMLSSNNNGKFARIFTGKELMRASNNFSKENLIGGGGFGEVYKGILDDKTITAIKRAKPGNTKGTDQVLNEVRILCQVNHRCLVRLLGCCVELEQPLLIYEYIVNGTLFDHLHCHFTGKWDPLPWHRRLTIAHQTAEGLTYLHSAAVPPIYHLLMERATKLDLETMKVMGSLAAACLDERRQNRPSMKEVADEIEYIISINTGDVSESKQAQL
ncbi:hypothetical protein LWI29_023575 [Acer saccharum]|uniref:Protein kinase domain-containing protein n=1 Tax=Acer saccharum TaxID=4024 RepID=A0AA39VH22_ACESA|nr:hypothetical protein LWI29_023575 [Acer saccharum]